MACVENDAKLKFYNFSFRVFSNVAAFSWSARRSGSISELLRLSSSTLIRFFKPISLSIHSFMFL